MRVALSLAVLLWLTATGETRAADAETVSSGLDRPCGAAVQPGTGHVFLVESGAGRVVRVVDGGLEPVVVGLGKVNPQAGSEGSVAPLGLTFVSEKVLVLCGWDASTSAERLCMYQVPEVGSSPKDAGACTASLQLSEDDPPHRQGPYFGVAANSHILYATGHDGSEGWLGRGIVRNGRLAAWVPFKLGSEDPSVQTPGPVAISPRGEIVVGQLGKAARERDSRLTFRSANDGSSLLDLETGLFDISGLVYGSDGQLYATDYAAAEESAGGLFQLIAMIKQGRQSVRAERLLELQRPTSLAAGKDGTLYVTLAGSGEEAKSGRLLKISL